MPYDPEIYELREEQVENHDSEGGKGTVQVPVRFVTVYEVTRHSGGPEEGGWWYNWRRPMCSIPTEGTKADVEAIKAFLAPRFVDEGDIYSVRGGVEYHIETELEAGESASKETPRYE